MQRIARHTTLTSTALLVAAFASALSAQPSRTPQLSGGAAPSSNAPAILQQIGIDQKLGAQVPLDLPFRDEEGRAVKLGDYFGKKPVVLCLVYYECPMLCTMVLNGTVRAMRACDFSAGREFDVVTVSFNPKDTPRLAKAKKENYLKEYGREGAAEGWHFLTGKVDAINQLTQAVGFRYQYDPANQQYAHASGIMVLTPQGTVARYLLGVEYSARDLQFSVMEASAGKIGSKVDQLVLYCYHYDPARGRYGVAVMRLLQAAAAITLIGVASMVTFMVRRERRMMTTGPGGPAGESDANGKATG